MPKPQTLSPLAALMRQQREAQATAANDEKIAHQAPTSQVAPVTGTPQPLPVTGAVSLTAPVTQAAPTSQVPAGYFRLTHEVVDKIIPTLDVFSQSVLIQLLRLSWGFQKEECRIGLLSLSNRCNFSQSQARRAVRILIQRGFIKQIAQDFDNPNQHERGTTYKIMITVPPTRLTGAVRQVAPVRQTAPTCQVPNKHTAINNTHNTEGVRVSSRFTLTECRRYADSLRADGITNPGGYATKIQRSGEADELIAKFLEPVESAKAVDISGCPDCHGTGFYEPGGAGKGVARCKHERLRV